MADPGIIQTIAIQGFSGMLSNLASKYVGRKGRKINQSEEIIKTDLHDHINNTFIKCTKVKTILNSNAPAETLSIYVDQSFSYNDNNIDQYELVETIKKGGAFVVTGTGGGGKSMFMRYLWLSFFENPNGKIPFFLELRNLNRLTHQGLEDFIYHSIIKSGSRISQTNFTEALRSGEFVLFLDGFDEVNFDRRDTIQDMIIELQEQNPKITIVVTSRPDERFSGWTQFHIVNVLPLNKKQSIELIERAPYEAELREKFLKKIDELYRDHQDFLSNPLLAYMMLVTFSFNPDIPNKMFLFYEQAFEALYHRHDLTKNYKRKFYSNIEKQEFIKLISFFCLKTYYDESYEFTYESIIEAINEVKRIESCDVEAECFLRDLIESVCIIKIEGLIYTFTHRSFQEYFSANCIARVAIREIDKIFSEFAKRYSDSVMSMVYDINPDLFREKYIIPYAKKYRAFINRKTKRGIYESFASKVGAEFTVTVSPRNIGKRSKEDKERREYNIGLSFEGEMKEFYHNMLKIIGNDREKKLVETRNSRNKADKTFMRRLSEEYSSKRILIMKIYIENRKIRIKLKGSDVRGMEFKNIEIDEGKWVLLFRESGMYEYICESGKLFVEKIKNEERAYNNVSTAFKDLF